MQKYIVDYYASRKRHMGSNIPCEVCRAKKGIHLKINVRSAVDIHHIKSSSRGKRTHNKDGSNLIGVCRKCHDWIHSSNNESMREWLLCVCSEVLKKIKDPEKYTRNDCKDLFFDKNNI